MGAPSRLGAAKRTRGESAGAHTLTGGGDVQRSADEKKFGASSLYFDGDGDYISVPDSDDWDFGPGEASLRKMLKQALGKRARFRNLSNEHPIYHSFFDFDGPPPGEEVDVNYDPSANLYAHNSTLHYRSKPAHFLEGIFLGDRLVAVYSDKAYGKYWEREYENEPQLKMGVNMVVFALTQQGSIAQQHIDFYEHSAVR